MKPNLNILFLLEVYTINFGLNILGPWAARTEIGFQRVLQTERNSWFQKKTS